jgi:uncharacterized protein YjbI with pentapeptide repeats
MARFARWTAPAAALALLVPVAPPAAPLWAANLEALQALLANHHCPRCRLQDADLVHADLRDAQLQGAQLQRANLSQARLDGAVLAGANLSFTSLQGASLRGADLRGALLEGTDLRQSDLSGALLDAGALSRSHWQQAVGIAPDQLSYVDLHNAGVEAALAGRQTEAERFFGEAIRRQPEAAISWAARGISRSQQGKSEQASSDLSYAATLYERGGDGDQAKQLRQFTATLDQPTAKPPGGNGMGSQLLHGAMGLMESLAPLAIKYLVPLAL